MSEQAGRVPWRSTHDLETVCTDGDCSFSMMLCICTSLPRIISVCRCPCKLTAVGGVGWGGRPMNAGEAPLIM